MKITLEKKYKVRYTVEDLERAKAIIKQQKEEDGATVKEYATYAINEALKGTGDYLVEVLKAEAETARNCRVWNRYNDNSCDMDVWVSAMAKTARGFIECGAYLSDIWMGGAEDYRGEMFINHFVR